jgi:hypothetical protein
VLNLFCSQGLEHGFETRAYIYWKLRPPSWEGYQLKMFQKKKERVNIKGKVNEKGKICRYLQKRGKKNKSRER